MEAIETVVVRSGAAQFPVGPVGYVVARVVAAGRLAVGTPVVVDAVNPVAEARARWRRTAAAAGAPLRVVEVVLASPVEHRGRVQQRRPDLPGQVVPIWERVGTWRYEQWAVERDGERLVVDGGDRCQGALAAVTCYLAMLT